MVYRAGSRRIRVMAVREKACLTAMPDPRAWLSEFERFIPPTDDSRKPRINRNPR